jgi:hypothetical protein
LTMIRFFLLQNRAGKTRLAKYYSPFGDDEKLRMEDEVHRLISTRDSKFTSFLEVSAASSPSFKLHIIPPHPTLITTLHPSPSRAVQDLQAGLPPLRRPLLSSLRGRLRQRAALPRDHPPLRRGKPELHLLHFSRFLVSFSHPRPRPLKNRFSTTISATCASWTLSLGSTRCTAFSTSLSSAERSRRPVKK